MTEDRWNIPPRVADKLEEETELIHAAWYRLTEYNRAAGGSGTVSVRQAKQMIADLLGVDQERAGQIIGAGVGRYWAKPGGREPVIGLISPRRVMKDLFGVCTKPTRRRETGPA